VGGALDGEVSIRDEGPWEEPPEQLDLEEVVLTGGAIHHWSDGGALRIIADGTHAFESDSSYAVDVKPSFEEAKEQHPLAECNFDYVPLARNASVLHLAAGSERY